MRHIRPATFCSLAGSVRGEISDQAVPLSQGQGYVSSWETEKVDQKISSLYHLCKHWWSSTGPPRWWRKRRERRRGGCDRSRWAGSVVTMTFLDDHRTRQTLLPPSTSKLLDWGHGEGGGRVAAELSPSDGRECGGGRKVVCRFEFLLYWINGKKVYQLAEKNVAFLFSGVAKLQVIYFCKTIFRLYFPFHFFGRLTWWKI